MAPLIRVTPKFFFLSTLLFIIITLVLAPAFALNATTEADYQKRLDEMMVKLQEKLDLLDKMIRQIEALNRASAAGAYVPQPPSYLNQTDFMFTFYPQNESLELGETNLLETTYGSVTYRKVISTRKLAESEIQECINKGCRVRHRLTDSTSFECPVDELDGLESKFGLKDVEMFQVSGMIEDQQVQADNLWTSSYGSLTGAGVSIIILDNGVDMGNPEINDSVVFQKDFIGEGNTDLGSHGTFITGLITATGIAPFTNARGIAPDAQVYMLKVGNKNGAVYEDATLAAMEFAVYNITKSRARIMSLSFGSSARGTSGSNCDEERVAAKANWVVDNGITVVAAAGNTPARVDTPACASKVIAVGATAADTNNILDRNNMMVASFSGRGKSLDIVAPGWGVYSTVSCESSSQPRKLGFCYNSGNRGYARNSGTSFSTPIVAGIIAQLLQYKPYLTDSQIKAALYDSATPVLWCINPDNTVRECNIFNADGRIYYDPIETGHGLVSATGAYWEIYSATKVPNDQKCTSNSGCLSNFCSNTICCNTGQCGWGAENGSPAMCLNNGSTKQNQWLKGVCRNGVWKTALNGWGCSIFPCDSGTCVSNICKAGLANLQRCSSNTQCFSGICSNGVCCSTGQCGWKDSDGSSICMNSEGTLGREGENFVCRSGQWKTASGALGCDDFLCDSGNCQDNKCILTSAGILIANGQKCTNSSECSSGNCINTYCCNSGQCGGVASPMCFSNGQTASNQWFSGICKSGQWRTVLNGIGCNIFPCDSGTCVSNYCRTSGTKLANGQKCNTSSQCSSGNCINTYCCNAGQCGGVASPMCFSNEQFASNQWASAVCRSGQWKIVLNGVGCNIFPCNEGTCFSNTCKSTIRLVGTCAADPACESYGRHLSSILVNKDLLVDFSCAAGGTCGVARLQQLGIDMNSINTLLITHYHGDHFHPAQIVALAQARTSTTPLTLYGGVTAANQMNDYLASIGKPGLVKVVRLAPYTKVAIGPYMVTPLIASHDTPSNEPYVYIIQHGGKQFLYGTDSDILTGASLANIYAAKLDLVIRERTFTSGSAWGHMDRDKVATERADWISHGVITTTTPYVLTHIAYCSPGRCSIPAGTSDPGDGALLQL